MKIIDLISFSELQYTVHVTCFSLFGPTNCSKTSREWSVIRGHPWKSNIHIWGQQVRTASTASSVRFTQCPIWISSNFLAQGPLTSATTPWSDTWVAEKSTHCKNAQFSPNACKDTSVIPKQPPKSMIFNSRQLSARARTPSSVRLQHLFKEASCR